MAWPFFSGCWLWFGPALQTFACSALDFDSVKPSLQVSVIECACRLWKVIDCRPSVCYWAPYNHKDSQRLDWLVGTDCWLTLSCDCALLTMVKLKAVRDKGDKSRCSTKIGFIPKEHMCLNQFSQIFHVCTHPKGQCFYCKKTAFTAF